MTAKPELPLGAVTRYEAWKEYERIAMHFNDLLIRLRTQSIGGVAAIAAIAGVVVHTKVPERLRWGFMAGAFSLLALFWCAIWVLDFRYYNRLLEGAVHAIMVLEKLKQPAAPLDTLDLSTAIENAVRDKPPSARLAGGFGRWAFYTIVLAGLVGSAILCACLAAHAGVGGASDISDGIRLNMPAIAR